MIETTQVQEIYQIDGIENLLDYEFSFTFYDFVSNIKTYEYRTQKKIIEINMICSERIILSHLLLSDLITQDNILFFSVNEYEYELNEDNEVVKHELKKSSFYNK
tara:strand:- start:570 stop:884 length:315 start_codon:yes stop_codon:yes gene_type:complete